MDPGLQTAAVKGDVEFLRRAVAKKSSDYFLIQDYDGDNIIHLAARNNQVEFVNTASKLLPTKVVFELVSQINRWDSFPLHTAAWSSSATADIVKVIVDFYKSYSGPYNYKPWLTLDNFSRTPLHSSLYKKNEESAMEILSLGDIDFISSKLDSKGNSPLFLAIIKGYNLVAEKILKSSCSYSLNGENGSTALHFAPNSSENILRLLLKNHVELFDKVDDDGRNILHTWAEEGKVWVLDLVLNEMEDFPTVSSKIFKELLFSTTEKEKGDTPIHTATRMGNIEFIQVLMNGYKQVTKSSSSSSSMDTSPCKMKNTVDGDTPLHVALVHQKKRSGVIFFKT